MQRKRMVLPAWVMVLCLFVLLGHAVDGRSEQETAPTRVGASGPLIKELEDLKTAVLAKIDSDVETTARAFWDAYNIQQSRKVADFVLAPLTVIEQALGTVSFAKNIPEIFTSIERAENILQVVSLFMGLSQLNQVGQNLQVAIDGPAYSSLLKAMLTEAAASTQPGEYATTVKLYLYGISGRRSPVGVPLQVTDADGPRREMAWGAEAVKRRASDRINALIREITETPVGTITQVEAAHTHLATFTDALKRSRMDSVTVISSVALPGKGESSDLMWEGGSIGALEQVRRKALAQYDNDLRLEQVGVLTSAVKAGTQAISLKVGYKTPGGNLLKEVQRDVIAPGMVLVNTLTKTYTTGARYQVSALPHEMVLSLPGELANTWKVVDEVVAAVRSLAKPPVVTARSNVQGNSPISSTAYAQPTPPDFVTKTIVDPETQVRFSLKRKYRTHGRTAVEIDPCSESPMVWGLHYVYVLGEVPTTVDLTDDLLAKTLLQKGYSYAIDQCGKDKYKPDAVKVTLYQSPFDNQNWTTSWLVKGEYPLRALFRDLVGKLSEYVNKPLAEARQRQREQEEQRKAEEKRRREEAQRKQAEEERRRREAEAAAKPARLQEIETLRRSGPKALLALTQALGDKDPEVRGKASAALREVARAGFSELGQEARDAIPALTEASKKGDEAARYALRRIKFPNSPPDSCQDELSERLDGLLASERARPCPVEGDEERKAAADKLALAFMKRHAVSKAVTCDALHRNPFTYDGVTVMPQSMWFSEMLARDRALFGLGGCMVAVSGIPHNLLPNERVRVILAGRVVGNTEVQYGPLTVRVPDLRYVGIHICKDPNCDDFFGPASMR